MMRGLEGLRRRVRELGEGRSRRYSSEVQAEILRAVRILRDEGASWARVADELDVSVETLRRWWHAARQEAAPGPTLVPVEVVVDEQRTHDGIVVMPSGVRVEGLDVAAIAELLRALS